MSNGPSDVQMLKALQASGYLFEQEVATTLESLGFHVETNSAFLDREMEKSRELDARAIKVVHTDHTRKIQVIVELLVECKDMDAPLVFITRSKNKRELDHPQPSEYLFPRTKYNVPLGTNTVSEKPGFTYFELCPLHYYYRESEKATQFAKIVRKGSEWVANHEGIYDALILPMAKALEARKSAVKTMVQGGIVWLFFSMVVIRGNLFSFKAGDSSAVAEPRQRISFIRELDSEVVKGHYLSDFVVFEHLRDFITNDVLSFAAAVVEIAQTKPEVLLGKST